MCLECVFGYYGSNCLLICFKNCDDFGCNWVIGFCKSCLSGKYGNKCNCIGKCDLGGCNLNGICYVCDVGYIGLKCLEKCFDECKESFCFRNKFCFFCIENRFGS